IGTVRREYLDRTLFWNRGDLERKLDNCQAYYNQHRCHTGLAGATPARTAVAYPHSQSLNFSHIPGGNIATAYFRPQLPPELEFDTDRQARWVSDNDVRQQNQFIDQLFDL